MRILYLTFAVRYINPTTESMLAALPFAGELDVFGPGFQSKGRLAEGPAAYVERHGPFDIVLTDEYAIQDFDLAPGEKPRRFVNHACRFDRSMLMYGKRFKDFFAGYGGRRGVFLLQTDYYNMPESRLRVVEDHFDYVLGWGAELISRRETVASDADRAAGLTAVDRGILDHWSDRYLEFVLRHPERIVSLPHVIADSELCERPLDRRRRPWAVVGADYTERVNARRVLDDADIRRTGNSLPYISNALQRLGINPYAHFWSIALLQRRFRAALQGARYAYTCGGAASGAIRKYFEIPAAGCVLVADRCKGFEALGFRDRENAVLARGADVKDVHDWRRRGPGNCRCGSRLGPGAAFGESARSAIIGRFSRDRRRPLRRQPLGGRRTASAIAQWRRAGRLTVWRRLSPVALGPSARPPD